MASLKRVKPGDFFTALQWHQISRRSDLKGIGMIVHAWTVIFAMMALCIWQPLFIILAIPIIGARQLGLAIIMHEAAHGGVSKSKKLNDFLGLWLAGAPIGGSLKSYRPYHLLHHKFTQQAQDPDIGLSAPFPITKRSLRRKIIRDLTGQTFYKQRFNQISNALGLNLRKTGGNENRATQAREAVIPFLLTNFILLAGLTLAGVWWAFFILWLLPLATWNQLVTRLRNIAEHAVIPDDNDPLRHARTVRTNALEKAIIAPYWVNYHCEHHMFMHVPCYNLPLAHKYLQQNGHAPKMEIQSGYRRILDQASSRPDRASA